MNRFSKFSGLMICFVILTLSACSEKDELIDIVPDEVGVDTTFVDLVVDYERNLVNADLAALQSSEPFDKDDVLHISIDDNLHLNLEIHSKNEFVNDIKSYNGVISGDSQGTFSFSVEGQKLFGSLQLINPPVRYQMVFDEEKQTNVLYKLK
jgi:hypothetical protein